MAKEVYEQLESQGLECVDATCPFVKRIHDIVEKESSQGKHIVIIGNPGHPEVEGIKGWCVGDAAVIESKEQAEAFVKDEKNLILKEKEICIVSQTTFNYNKFKELVEIF